MAARNIRCFPRQLTTLNSVASFRYSRNVLAFRWKTTVEFLLESEIRTSLNRIPILQLTGCVAHIDDMNDLTRFALNHESTIACSQLHQPPCNSCSDIDQYNAKNHLFINSASRNLLRQRRRFSHNFGFVNKMHRPSQS